ncbi:MAG: PIG-L family deacetylase [Chthoniobacter sp.]|nr:PIG-L family deacetylase [Chthoniobacter sp.]
MPQTILAIGAHYDDCVFGIPGILLKAVAQHHRVVIVAVIGDYAAWPPVVGRDAQLLEVSRELARERGMEMRFLSRASAHFRLDEDTQREVAEIVAEVKPDTAFLLWPHDRHPDHEAASAICRAALAQPHMVLGRAVAAPRHLYCFDNGPRHTIGFEPNTFVDVTHEWDAAMDWLGRLMAFVNKTDFDPTKPDSSRTLKETIARYRGATCGVKYAEAVWAMTAAPSDIL